jgi:hypothetical protein
MRKTLIIGVLAVFSFSSASYGQFLGEGTGGYVARRAGPTGATGGGHHEPMGFGLLATNSCWPDAVVGCNSMPNPPAEQPAEEAPAPEAPTKAKKKR